MHHDSASAAWGKRLVAIGLLTVTATLAGCGGSGIELVPVQGNVSYDGEPISEGRIQFRMNDGDRKAYAGQIIDGKYAVEVEPGPASVQIRASRLIPGKMDESNPDDPQPMGEMYIPEKYNSRTELTAEIEGPEDQEDFTLSAS
jgi:hypothetical protein